MDIRFLVIKVSKHLLITQWNSLKNWFLPSCHPLVVNENTFFPVRRHEFSFAFHVSLYGFRWPLFIIISLSFISLDSPIFILLLDGKNPEMNQCLHANLALLTYHYWETKSTSHCGHVLNLVDWVRLFSDLVRIVSDVEAVWISDY